MISKAKADKVLFLISKAKADELLFLYESARVARFNDGELIVTAVSVSDKDMKRPKVIALLKGDKPLFAPDECLSFMTMWVQCRTWFPFKAKPVPSKRNLWRAEADGLKHQGKRTAR